MHKAIYTIILAGLLVAICTVVSGCGGGIDLPEILNDWALMWGGTIKDEGDAVTVDREGNVFVIGSFTGAVDFDPGEGTDVHASVEEHDQDMFISKFDAGGVFQWARTWGGVSMWRGEVTHDVAVGGSGDVYVIGHFQNEVDFDPGNGVDQRVSNAEGDIFLSKFNPNGDRLWSLTWGGDANDSGFGVEVDDNGDIYITGHFGLTVDLDPGDGVEEHSSNGDADVFVSKFDANGDFIWAYSWGGGMADYPSAIALDEAGCILISGSFFSEVVDFDPGPDVDEHESFARYDVFLSKLNTGGDYEWALTWGGYGDDSGPDVAVDRWGNVYVAGRLDEPMDLDPGEGTTMLYSKGYDDIYLGKFDPDGVFQWAYSWGGQGYEYFGGVCVDEAGDIYVSGDFDGTVDFDPGTGKYVLKAGRDVFLSKFNPDGQLQWVGQWRTEDYIEYAGGIAVDNLGRVFITGSSVEYINYPPLWASPDVPPFDPDVFLIRFPWYSDI